MLAATVFATTLALAAPAAQAASQHVEFKLSAFPAGYDWHGVGDPPKPEHADTGGYWGHIELEAHGRSGGDTQVQQIRGGVILGVDGGYDEAAGKWRPVSLQPGDLFRIVRRADGAVLAQTSFSGQPVVTSAALGATAVGGTKDAATTGLSVEHERRVARTYAYSEYVPGTYHWEVREKVDPADPDRDLAALDPADEDYDVIPPQPVLTAGQQALLVRDTAGATQSLTREKRYFEAIGVARLTGLSESTFAAQLAEPLAAGDVVTTVQTTRQIVADVQTTAEVRVSALAGIAPPADTTAPAVVSLDLAQERLSVGDFLRRGLTTFTAVGEPGSIAQELRVSIAPPKGKSKGKGKPKSPGKAKGKKSRREKAPAKVYVVARAAGSVAFAGQTVKLTLKPERAARKRISAGKKVTLTLVTTLTDAAGNVAVDERKVALRK